MVRVHRHREGGNLKVWVSDWRTEGPTHQVLEMLIKHLKRILATEWILQCRTRATGTAPPWKWQLFDKDFELQCNVYVLSEMSKTLVHVYCNIISHVAEIKMMSRHNNKDKTFCTGMKKVRLESYPQYLLCSWVENVQRSTDFKEECV